MPETTPGISAVARRAFLALFLAAAGALTVQTPAAAAPTGAEAFVQSNVVKGLAILNNRNASADQKRAQFQTFILGLTDMKRIANFTLGSYRRTATDQEKDAFAAAFQNYAIAVYQSYFAKYSGQSLRVSGSQENAPGDTTVVTHLIDPNDHSGQAPLEVDFRVLSDNGKFVVVDFTVASIDVAIEEQAQFTAFLGQNNGSIAKLIADLNEKRKQMETDGARN